jgi:hypothetical protein
MFEKPQYFTKDGFKRCAKNPYKNQTQSLVPLGDKKMKQLPSKAILHKKNLKGPLKGPGISDEAARLIAGVLKGMLK